MKILSYLDNISYQSLFIALALLGLLPLCQCLTPLKKIILLSKGELVKPIDIFDLIFHLSPVILITLKFYYSNKRRFKLNGSMDFREWNFLTWNFISLFLLFWTLGSISSRP